jgi:hypothetical protein
VTDEPSPDIPASRSLVVDVVAGRDRGVRRALDWGKVVLEAAERIEPVSPTGSVDHWAKLRVSDRWTGEVVYEQDWGHDSGGAEHSKATIQGDLERMDLPAFLAEYGIDWSPPEHPPASG